MGSKSKSKSKSKTNRGWITERGKGDGRTKVRNIVATVYDSRLSHLPELLLRKSKKFAKVVVERRQAVLQCDIDIRSEIK